MKVLSAIVRKSALIIFLGLILALISCETQIWIFTRAKTTSSGGGC
ncbi:MAG: hypothetical protein L3J12_09510 [Spirochaetales bacterium]|nr:hypothetical protein [Spirochaetales bacterium]